GQQRHRIADRVAGKDRLQPSEPGKARGGAELRRSDALSRKALAFSHPERHEALHPHCAGVPDGGAEAAEQRVLGQLLVEMKWLRVEIRCKADNDLSREGKAADRYGLAERVELSHAHGRLLFRLDASC